MYTAYSNTDPRHGNAQQREHLQGHEREPGDQVEIEADQPVQRILGLAGGALLVGDLDLGGAVRQRVRQRGNEGVDFRARGDVVGDRAAVRAEHAALVGHADVGDALAHGVHRARGGASPPGVLAMAADTPHVVGAGVHRRQQTGDFLGWILQVGIERHHALAAHVLNPATMAMCWP